MNLFDVLRPECVQARVACAGKEEALAAVARLARRSPLLSGVGEEELLEGLRRREALGSTGFGGGIAIPHCRLRGVRDFVVGLLTVPGGVDFAAADGKEVRVLAFIIAPETESTEHLRLLSAVSRALSAPGALEEMLRAETAEVLRECFLRHVREELPTRGHATRRLFHVFVQEKEYFEPLLAVFAGLEGAAVSVLEAHNSREYLARVPLFAGLWSDGHLGFQRLIVALVDKAMTNEVVRQIEAVAGPLDSAGRVLVAIQDVFYSAGSLEA